MILYHLLTMSNFIRVYAPVINDEITKHTLKKYKIQIYLSEHERIAHIRFAQFTAPNNKIQIDKLYKRYCPNQDEKTSKQKQIIVIQRYIELFEAYMSAKQLCKESHTYLHKIRNVYNKCSNKFNSVNMFIPENIKLAKHIYIASIQLTNAIKNVDKCKNDMILSRIKLHFFVSPTVL